MARYRQLRRFIVVGCAAALVHLLIVTALVRLVGWPPLVANIAGWLVAFWVSFIGHYGWTFQGTVLTASTSARRFLLLSASGFLVNEGLYAAALHWSRHRFDLLLVCVLLVTAVLTFVASRLWAFEGTARPP
jgi:putative flippase GtrA